jgi:hypothetical protein
VSLKRRQRLLFGNNVGAGAAVVSASFSATLLSTLVPQVSTGGSTPTFTRATTAYEATYLTTIAAGFTLQQCAAGEARFTGARRIAQDNWSILDSNSVAITAGNGADSRWADAASNLGYHSEGAATNLALWSNDWTNAAWVKTTMTTAFTSTGPDGVANSATRITATAGNALALQTILAAASSRTFSLWVKRITGSGNFQLTQDGAAFTTVTTTAGWTKVELNASILNATIGVRIVTNGDAFDVWCGQFEAGASSSSPIPTTTVSVTRNGDKLSYSAASNINNVTGTCYLEIAVPQAAAAAGNLLAFADASLNRQVFNINASTVTAYDFTNTPSWTFTVGGGTVRKCASSWGSSLWKFAGDGSYKTPDGAFNNNLGIGVGYGIGAFQLQGNIRNLVLYSSAKTGAELAALTT